MDEKRDVRAKVRTYQKDGETKNVYITVGTAWVSEHGSKISIALDSVPVSPEWDGKLYINKPYEPKQGNAKPDKVIDDIGDEPIRLEDIPFN